MDGVHEDPGSGGPGQGGQGGDVAHRADGVRGGPQGHPAGPGGEEVLEGRDVVAERKQMDWKSFGRNTARKLNENATTLIEAVVKAKPSASKGRYVNSVTLCSTMSPAVDLNVAELTS